MNLAVVTRAAAGLIGWLAARGGQGPLLIGYDARHGSRDFAERTARVATGAGREALLLPRPLPTPVLAYAVRALDAVAGVMVTASHNPPQDNGYKVYLGRQLGGPAGAGAQIVPPADAEIEAAIKAVGPLAGIRLGGPGTVLDDKIIQGYVQSAAAVLAPGRSRGTWRWPTPRCTGSVGHAGRRVRAAGFAAPAVVPEQFAPDPDFPTVAFPNPEEPGAMDRLTALAAAVGADLAIANDPDADRCAVADPDAGGWRTLRGDELGVLLADHLIRRGTTGVYATTIVSSSLLRALCAARGLPYAETLTGFKWIVRGPPRTRLRLRGGARLLRGARARAGQGRDHRGADRRRAGRRAQGAGAHPHATGWTSWRPSSACTPPTSSRSGSPTWTRSAAPWRCLRGTAADRAARRTRRRAGPAARQRRADAAYRAAPGWWSARPVRNRS